MIVGLMSMRVSLMTETDTLDENEAASWYLYLIKCRNGSLYTGITTDVQRRFAEHSSSGPKAARYLRGKGPLELVFSTKVGGRGQASIFEYRVKKLSKATKQELIAGRASFWVLMDESR